MTPCLLLVFQRLFVRILNSSHANMMSFRLKWRMEIFFYHCRFLCFVLLNICQDATSNGCWLVESSPTSSDYCSIVRACLPSLFVSFWGMTYSSERSSMSIFPSCWHSRSRVLTATVYTTLLFISGDARIMRSEFVQPFRTCFEPKWQGKYQQT